MKRQCELPAFFGQKSDVRPESSTWLVALDQSPGLSPPGLGTELIAVPVFEGADPAYPTFMACFFPASPAGFQGADPTGFRPALSDNCLNTGT